MKIQGYARLGIINPNIDTLEFAESIGKIIANPEYPTVQRLTPKIKSDAPKNVYSGNYGLKEFPLHTDLAHWHIPPRYLILRSVVPVPKVYTIIVHKKFILDGLPFSVINRALFKPRRRLDNKQFLLRINQEQIFRWDQLFLKPVNDEAKAIMNHIINYEYKKDAILFELNKPYECIILDNWLVLHGRSQVPISGASRVIERIYLSEIIK